MKQLKTAKEFIKENLTDHWQGGKTQYIGEDVEKAMIEFAKHHVEVALESAAENGKVKDIGLDFSIEKYVIDKESILTSYPLNNVL